jgi:hypothetical protein
VQVKRPEKFKWNQGLTGACAEIVSAHWASADIRAETEEERDLEALKPIQRLPIICRDSAWPRMRDSMQFQRLQVGAAPALIHAEGDVTK